MRVHPLCRFSALEPDATPGRRLQGRLRTLVGMTQQLPQRRLGDRSVSAIGLGAMPMSVREVNDEQRGIATILRALELGVTLIDTADAYSIGEDDFGANEALVGKALKEYAGGDGEVLVA